MRHWGAERLLNGAEIGALCFKKRVEKGKKRNHPRVWGERCWKRWGGCAGPPPLKGSLVSPPAAKPPAQAAPRCGFGGDPSQGLLCKNPPKKAEFGVPATALLCSGAGGQVGAGEVGHGRAGRTDGQTDRDGESLQKISAGKGGWQGVKRQGWAVVGF